MKEVLSPFLKKKLCTTRLQPNKESKEIKLLASIDSLITERQRVYDTQTSSDKRETIITTFEHQNQTFPERAEGNDCQPM